MKLSQHTTNGLKLTLFAASFLLCSWQLFSFVNLHAPVLIYADRWYSMDPIFSDEGFWKGFLHKHGPHRMGLIYMLFKTNASLSDWDSRWDMFLQSAFYTISALLAFRLKYLLFKRFDWWDWIIPCIFISIQAAQTVTFNPYVHGLIPFFATTISLSYFIRNRAIQQLLLSLLVTIGVFTGFALVCSLAVIIAEVTLFFTRGRKANYIVLVVVISAIAFMILTQNKSNPISLDGSFDHYIKYALWLIQDFIILQSHPKWIWISLINALGLLVLIFKAYPILKNWKNSNQASLIVLAGSSIIFVALSLSGRADLGMGNAITSRYIPAIMPFMLSVYFIALSLKPLYLKMTSLAILALIILRFQLKTDIPRIHNAISLTEQIDEFGDCLKQTSSLEICEGKQNFTLVPSTKKKASRKKLIS